MFYHNLLLHIETNCWIWWLLGSLLPLLLGIAIGYLMFSKYRRIAAQSTAECESLKLKTTALEENQANLEYQLEETTKAQQRTKTALQSCEADKAILQFKLDKTHELEDEQMRTAMTPQGPAVLFGHHNLQIIEGIGPKVEALLHEAGIQTWTDLATATFEHLRNILEAGGPAFSMQNPASWSEQAAHASSGNWDALRKLQKSLEGGEESGDGDTPSKMETMLAKKLGFSLHTEDLQIVEGIGPKIELLLNEAGIRTRQELAAASVASLRNILEKAGADYQLADPSSWPQQAALAAAGKWWELKQLQDTMS